MKYKTGKLTGKPARILLLFAILASLTPLALPHGGCIPSANWDPGIIGPAGADRDVHRAERGRAQMECRPRRGQVPALGVVGRPHRMATP